MLCVVCVCCVVVLLWCFVWCGRGVVGVCLRACYIRFLSVSCFCALLRACMVLACSMVILVCGFACEVEFGGGRLSLEGGRGG